MQIQRLKNKMGNVANASCETELRGAWAQMVGAEGRGVATILKMVTMTRFDCMIGSSSGMRQAVAQALHHCNYRSAFGKRLVDQPLMQNVLADLVIEHEAALALTMRIGVRSMWAMPVSTKRCWFAWARPWANTGSANARRPMPTRPWNA
jgi:putative acyl-CoA dehydrogenase